MSNLSNFSSTLLDVLRIALSLLGGLMFGFGCGTIGTHLLLNVVLGPIGPDGWGAAPAWILICLAGGLAGLVAGVVLAIAMLRSSSNKPFEWIDLLVVQVGSVLAGSLTYYLFSTNELLFRLIPVFAAVPTGGFVARWCLRTFVLKQRFESNDD